MNNALLNVRGGVLVIGSLLWQDDLGEKINLRKEWRRKFLDLDGKIEVYAPIRYGRLSGGNVFIMTFSNSCRKRLGTAYFIPFRKTIQSWDQLLKEAQELSNAEGMEQRFIKSMNNIPWCVTGIQFNSDKINPDVKQLISERWDNQIKADPDYKLFNHENFGLGSESRCILQNGHLNFPWIRAVHTENEPKLNEYDFLIATATLATSTKYPTITKMVANVRTDKDRQYFRNNNRYGITTYQDARILKKL